MKVQLSNTGMELYFTATLYMPYWGMICLYTEVEMTISGSGYALCGGVYIDFRRWIYEFPEVYI
ncbi:MAG: hypothetical protein WCH34_01995 [Bacteroidota bacterium]